MKIARGCHLSCLVGLVAILPLIASAADDLQQWRLVEPARAMWTRGQTGATAEALASGWSGLLTPEDAPPNCRLEFQFTIQEPCRPGWTNERGAFCNYHAGREDSGYEAAALVRYADDEHFYRVAFSSRGQEVAIWKPGGGFVHVAPASVVVGKPQRVAIEARGPWLEVFLNDQPVARYYDAVEPVLSGGAGLAACGATVRFDSAKIVALQSQVPAAPPPEPSRFHWRTWRGGQWIFDRAEPIALLDRQTLTLWEVKLEPGFRPVLYWELFWKQYDGPHNYSDRLVSLDTLQQDGQEMQIAWQSQDPTKRITTSASMTLTRDKQLGFYAYEVQTQFVVNPGQTWRDTADGLEYCNLIPYNVVGPATRGQPGQWPWWYQWVVYTQADGSLGKYPLSHNRQQHVPLKPDGGLYGYFGRNRVNPVVFFQNPTDPALAGYAGLCNWAHDIHFRYRPYAGGHVMPAGTKHEARYRVVGFDASRSARSLNSARLHPYFRESEQYPVYTSGLNTFRASCRRGEPQTRYQWLGGDWDASVGHGDRQSIRLSGGQAGKDQCSVDVGGSNFSEPIRFGLYTLSAWIKTDGVKGPGATLGLQLLYPEEKPLYAPRRIKGTGDWQQVRFTTYLPNRAAARVILQMEGPGTAWFDDVELKYPDQKGVFFYEAERLSSSSPHCDVVDDPEATGGRAFSCKPGKQGPGVGFFGPYSTAEPPGDYVAMFRVRAGDNRGREPLLQIDVHEGLRGVIAHRTLQPSDFRLAGRYQYFALPFTRQGPEPMQYRAWWPVGAECRVDHVAVVPQRELWAEDLHRGCAVDQAQWYESGYWATERVGQTFVATGSTLQRIDLVVKNRTDTRPGVLRLWKWKGNYPDTVKSEPLFAEPVDLSGPDLPQTRHWMPKVGVEPGQTYFLETCKPGHHAGIIYHDADAYPGGMMYSDGQPRPGCDLRLTTYAEDSSPASPAEPKPLPKVSRPSLLPPRASQAAIGREDYLNLVRQYVDSQGDAWLRADGAHGHRQAFYFAFLYKATGDESWARRAIERFRAAARWWSEHPQQEVGFPWLPTACLPYQWIAGSPSLDGKGRQEIRRSLLDGATRHWPLRERGAMNRSMGSALGYALMAKLFPDEPLVPQWRQYAQDVWNDWACRADTDENSLHYHAVWWEYVVTYAAEIGQESIYARPEVRKLIERWRDQISPLGPLPPYGDCYGWGFEWGGWVLLFEKAAAVYRDGTFKTAAHRLFGYLASHAKNTPPHLITYEDMWRLALAYLHTQDEVAEQPMGGGSKLLWRRDLVLLPVEERKLQRRWFELGAGRIPDKLILRGSPEGMFAALDLVPFAGHGHFGVPSLVTLTDRNTALLTDSCYEDREAEHHSHLYVKRLAGGRLLGEPSDRVSVPRFIERPELTYCEILSADSTGWGTALRREVFFAKDRFLWIGDQVRFSQALQASAGPLWHAAEVVARGPNWFDVAWNEPRGFLWSWRNGPRRLLIYFVPRPGTVVDYQYLPWKTQRLFHQWSPPVCLYQKLAAIQVNAATELRFDTLLIPHDPGQDPSQLAAGIQAGTGSDGARYVTLSVPGRRLTATIGRDGPTIQGN